MPGLLISTLVAVTAAFLSDHYGAPVMIFALLLGMAFSFLADEHRCCAGMNFASKSVLRIGVALLGVRITAGDVLELGSAPFILAISGVVLTILIGMALARCMGQTRDFGLLSGAAVGICGASAALAVASVLPRHRNGIGDRDVIFVVVGVTTLSTVAMIVYPVIAVWLNFGDMKAGIFLGATIHDVAQVVGAAYTLSKSAGEAATVTKLLRVSLLFPVVIAVLVIYGGSGSAGSERPSFPFFLLPFILLAALNSVGVIPEKIRSGLEMASHSALLVAIAALGIKTSLKDLAAVGPKALVLLIAETLWIAAVALLFLWIIS